MLAPPPTPDTVSASALRPLALLLLAWCFALGRLARDDETRRAFVALSWALLAAIDDHEDVAM